MLLEFRSIDCLIGLILVDLSSLVRYWYFPFYSPWNLMDILQSIIGWFSCHYSYGKCWSFSVGVRAFLSGVKAMNSIGKTMEILSIENLHFVFRILRAPDNDCRELLIFFLLHILIFTFEFFTCDKLNNHLRTSWLTCFIPLFVCTFLSFISCLWSLKVQRNFLVSSVGTTCVDQFNDHSF